MVVKSITLIHVQATRRDGGGVYVQAFYAFDGTYRLRTWIVTADLERFRGVSIAAGGNDLRVHPEGEELSDTEFTRGDAAKTSEGE